ncbi:sigma-70 family RNA polymerase sigma factor [Lonepinella koalarum]|uniref:RNA polymerase sigma-70 factor (ECF subfamily) n=1 Tax=Lonepinella koalarum TaxID=53417 RepID=A0A4R1KWY7_9PAST|nr:sigma-70 family RNA polymerase sigma factor [Lonepinella koalarum]TCK69842.1 RNA polymerase sigma-70 factor (ECF subfamily) [Lonepinella koalarum]
MQTTPSLIQSEQLAEIREQMLKFALLQLRDMTIAEDMVQEALLSALKNIDSFQRQSALKTWIFAILKNKIIDYLRQKDRFVLESDLVDDDEENNPFFDQNGHWKTEYYPESWQENAVYSDEFWLLFETCLTHLPAKQSRVFMMREYLDFSANEICQEVDITSGNLHILLYRARLQLQHCLTNKLA